MNGGGVVGPGAMRLFALTGCVAVGSMAGEAATVPAIGWVVGGAAVLVLAVLRARVALVVLAVAVGFTLASVRTQALADARLAEAAVGGALASVTAEVLTDGREVAGASRFAVRITDAVLDGVPAPDAVGERAWVTVRPPSDPDVTVGDVLAIGARLAPVWFDDMDAQGAAAARRLRHRGIAARAFASPEDVSVLGRSDHPLVRIADAGRRAVSRAASRLSERRAGLLLGITIGDVSRLPVDMDVDFRTTGLSHLVAVSGANVAMVLAVVALALRLLRAGRTLSIAVLSATVIAFMAVTRFEPSVLRAGVMALVALGGLVVGAGRAAITTLAGAVLILVVRDPFLIHSAGFQLSVAATLGIVVLGPRLRERLPAGPLGLAASVTLGAQLAVAPLLVIHFHRLSIASIGANLLAAPAVAPATVLGLAGAGLQAIAEPLGAVVVLAEPFLAWMTWVAASLASLPAADLALPTGLAALAISLLFIAISVRIVRGRRGGERYRARTRRPTTIAAALILIANAALWPRVLVPASPVAPVIIDMVDVGQGEAIIVRAGESVMLVDGGPDPRGMIEALRARRIARIDLLVSTHPHDDHVAGLVPVVRSMTVGAVLDPMIESDLGAYRAFTEAIAARGIPMAAARAGDVYALGPARIEVLWPPAEHLAGTGSDTNNNSVVLAVSFGDDRALLAGESEEAAQEALLAGGEVLEADVLKVAHHGSARMVPAFYAATGASVALIPVGDNRYGHPAPETLAALVGMQVWRSDLHGDVRVALDGLPGPLQVLAERG